MFRTVQLPLWLLILILAFAAVTFASHFLFPSVRWFLRRRAERVVARLNTRLTRPIEPFKLLKRQDTIQRLVYDPKVIEAVADYARENDVREDVAFEVAHRYAREIVPSFSATAYFGFATRAARLLARAFYRVRSGALPDAAHAALGSEAAVVFVINHRSNMDYVLLTYLVGDRSALSYAAGEWARVWPLGALVRAMGAYFVRRKSRNALYRRVMARYVQISTGAGVAQAVFPEGGLSIDGAVGPPKLGLLSYIIDGFDPATSRDVVFVPVALNYDRVLEDRVLVRAAETGDRRFRLRLRVVVRYLFRHFWQRATGTFLRYGYASVSFGTPLSLRQFVLPGPRDLVTDLGRELMVRVRDIVPVTPVPAVAETMLAADSLLSRAALADRVTPILQTFGNEGGLTLANDTAAEIEIAVNHLVARGILSDTEAGLTIVDSNRPLLRYYARSVAHRIAGPVQKQ